MPKPTPAPNIIENQEKLVISGLSSGRPSFRRPETSPIASARHAMMNAPSLVSVQAAEFSCPPGGLIRVCAVQLATACLGSRFAAA